jgi:hypothetical protein
MSGRGTFVHMVCKWYNLETLEKNFYAYLGKKGRVLLIMSISACSLVQIKFAIGVTACQHLK